MGEQWLIMKRGLYFRPDCLGYTGIKDQAGRYSHDFAKKYDDGECKIVRDTDAPEFLPAAYDDLVIKHLTGQRDALVKALEDARLQLEYVQEKHGYATGEAVLARIRHALTGVSGTSKP